MLNPAPYLIGAAVVGMLHMSAPDHWVTICIMGKSARWTRARIFGVSLVTASGHVILSVILGLAVVTVGVFFSRVVSSYLDLGIGIVMIVVGLIVGIRPFTVKGTGNGRRQEGATITDAEGKSLTKSISYFAVLGAALSPDLSITPVFLSAIPNGLYFALELSLVFALASILTLLLLVQLGSSGLAHVFEKVPEKYNDSLVGFVIAAIGVYILVSG